MRIGLAVIVMLAAAVDVNAEQRLLPGGAKRGAEVFLTQNCVACHSIRGMGGKVGPDLGRIIGRNYTPSWLASVMWNHAPEMWSAMEERGVVKPVLTESQAADLFAYFHSIRYFEPPGDAGRGKRAFARKRCADCHGLSAPIAGGGPAVSTWRSLTAPILLAQEMWNHTSEMKQAMARRAFQWPELTSQELTDILVYLQNAPLTGGRAGEFELDAVGNGEALLRERGCVNCHRGNLSLQARRTGRTLTDFAIAMWNHAPRMWEYGRSAGHTPARLNGDDMREIVAYVWYVQLFAEPGDVTAGRKVFQKKGCATCHDNAPGEAPDLHTMLASREHPVRPFSMASILWRHGPAMLKQMRVKNLRWPQFSGPEMVDLLAYLNSPTFRGSAKQTEQ